MAYLVTTPLKAVYRRGRSGCGTCPPCTCWRPNSAQRASVGTALAGIEQAQRIEGTAQAMELLELGSGKLDAHPIQLLHAHAVLAGNRTADRHAEFEYPLAESLGRLELAGLVGIVEDQGVQVAVAGMKDVADSQSVLRRQGIDAFEYGAELVARDGAIHAVIVGRDASGRRERGLAPGPEQGPFIVVAGRANLGGAQLQQLAAHDHYVLGDLGIGSVQFAQQDCRRLHRVACVDEVLGGADGGVVHHLQAGRNQPIPR